MTVDLARREIVHIGVTSSPSVQYAAQSFVEAVADRDNHHPRFMIRDRDSIYRKDFRRRVKSCGTRCLITPPRSPQANAICERLNGTCGIGANEVLPLVPPRASRLGRSA